MEVLYSAVIHLEPVFFDYLRAQGAFEEKAGGETGKTRAMKALVAGSLHSLVLESTAIRHRIELYSTAIRPSATGTNRARAPNPRFDHEPRSRFAHDSIPIRVQIIGCVSGCL